MPRLADIGELEDLRSAAAAERQRASMTLIVCGGPGCQASGCRAVADALSQELAREELTSEVQLRVTGCHGFCEQGPIIIVEPAGICYCRVEPRDIAEIVSTTVRGGGVVDRLLYADPSSGERVRSAWEIPFYRLQDRVLLALHPEIDSSSITDYIATGGYSTLAKALGEHSPDRVIKAITSSGLRGRGGGGFPTGRKWAACRAAPGDEKYLICNADEGDPGAYMDRGVLEGNPHLVLEGMGIGAWAIGARQGYIYVRNEYPVAVEHARLAVAQAREFGLLGENILGSSLCFDVEVARGGGAFVCGESTALMASLEGKVGEPRAKDVHTVEDGLWGKPTVLNNVETWANIPLIMRNGPAWFAAKGTKGSKGTKIFSLTGRVRNTGLVEVAMGTPLRTIIYDIGGGAADGVAIKAVQTGGPSGGCLPADKFDLPVDFDTLARYGSMVGSGGMVVMDEHTCMVEVARYFLAFLQDESCGKCVPCRIGVDRMLEIVTDITEGRGRPEQLELLEELGETVRATALCGLGKTAPNPVLSTLHYFREEYEAHVRERRCPAGVCRALIGYQIESARCTGCGVCRTACPHGAIRGESKQPHTIISDACQRCGICQSECRFEAIVLTERG
jgi:NADH-quinone oxidoreductase subunit F